MIKYPNDKFTKKRIFCNRYLFRGNLLDNALEACLESIGKVASCCEPNEGDECVKVKKIKGNLKIGDNGTRGYIDLVLTINGTDQFYRIDKNGDNKYKKNGIYPFEIALNESVCVEDITAVGLSNRPNPPSTAFNFDTLSISYTSSSFSGEKLFFKVSDDNRMINNNETDFWKPTPNIPGKEEPMKICSEEEICCSKQLLDHFNCNKLYYNQIIWRFENPQERIVRFENCLLNNLPLSCQITNQPIAVHGEWVIFELANSTPILMQPCIEEHTIISLPTAGLFQETLLGNCSSCEEPNIPVLEARKEFPCSCGCKGDVVSDNSSL